MRRDAVPSQASGNAAGGLEKPPEGSPIPASRGVERPCRWFQHRLLALSFRETGIGDRMGTIC